MSLDDDAVKPQKDAAAGPRTHFGAHRGDRLAGEQEADAGHKILAHGFAHVLTELPCSALGGLERDVAGEAFCDKNVDCALAQIVAFNEPLIAHVGQVGFAQHAPRRLHLLHALDLLGPDIEETHGGRFDVEYNSRHRRAHDGEIDEMLRVAANGRADIEDDRLAAQCRPHRRDRRPLDRRHRVQAELGHRHQGAGVAGRDRAIGRARLHRFNRLPHRRDAPSSAQSLAWLVAHLARDVGMKNARLGGELGMTLEDGADHAPLAVEKKLNVGKAFKRQGRGGQNDRWAMIATHRVQRYANVACHSLVRPRRARCPDGAARRDNSGSAEQGNARNSCSVTVRDGSFRLPGTSLWRKELTWTALAFKARRGPIRWSPAVEKKRRAARRLRDSFWRKNDTLPKAPGASTIRRGSLARGSISPANQRRSPPSPFAPSYSLTSARAIFWEMYPSTAPMIREITPTMKGFSSEAVVTAPSLLPVKASPATAAYPSSPAGMSLSIGALAAYTRMKTVIRTHIPAQSGTPRAPPSGIWVTSSSAIKAMIAPNILFVSALVSPASLPPQ